VVNKDEYTLRLYQKQIHYGTYNLLVLVTRVTGCTR